jgi:hypothetical protein
VELGGARFVRRGQQSEEAAMSAKPSKDDIIALEKSYWDAMKRKDGNRTAELSGDISVVTGPKGVMSIDKSKMGAMTEEGKWTLDDYTFEDVQISIPSSDVAIIAYKVKQTVTMDGKKQQMEAADMSTWLRGKDGWQCHAHSETMLGAAPAT